MKKADSNWKCSFTNEYKFWINTFVYSLKIDNFKEEIVPQPLTISKYICKKINQNE